RRRHDDRQRPRPEAFGQPHRQRRKRNHPRFDLRDVGGNQRQAAVVRPSLHVEQTLYRIGPKRIHGKPVQRVGRDGHDAAGKDPFCGFFDGVALRRLRIDRHTPHYESTIARCTAIAAAAMIAKSTKNTTRMLAPPRSPAKNGLMAMPTSDALVSMAISPFFAGLLGGADRKSTRLNSS